MENHTYMCSIKTQDSKRENSAVCFLYTNTFSDRLWRSSHQVTPNGKTAYGPVTFDSDYKWKARTVKPLGS